MKSIILNLLAFSTLLFSVFSITSKNPVISVLFLISTFVFAASYLLFAGIEFIGISYIIIYIGAIAVLFLFVIMMINIRLTDILETGSQYTKTLPLALVIISLFTYILYNILPYMFNVLPQQLNVSAGINELYNSSNLNIFDVLFNLNGQGMYIANSIFKNILISSFNTNDTVFNVYNSMPQIADTVFTNFLQIEAIGFNLYVYGAGLLILVSLILLLAMYSAIIITRDIDTRKTI